MYFPIKNGDFPISYVKLPEGKPLFSYGFPMVFPLKPPFSHGFHRESQWFMASKGHLPMVFTSPGPPQPKARGAHGWRSALRRSAGGSPGAEPWPWHRAAAERREGMGMGEVGAIYSPKNRRLDG